MHGWGNLQDFSPSSSSRGGLGDTVLSTKGCPNAVVRIIVDKKNAWINLSHPVHLVFPSMFEYIW